MFFVYSGTEIAVEWWRYVAKVIFTYILGYKVDIGHMEAVNLISSSKYSEKQIVRQMSTLFALFMIQVIHHRDTSQWLY